MLSYNLLCAETVLSTIPEMSFLSNISLAMVHCALEQITAGALNPIHPCEGGMNLSRVNHCIVWEKREGVPEYGTI